MPDLKEWSTNKDTTAAAITNSVELLLMAQECQKQDFLDNHMMLLQPTIWIGDMAATMDMTLHAKEWLGPKVS